MNAILDMVGASILFGILILTVARVQSNLNSTLYQNTYNLNTQTAAVNLALQIEYDLAKAGYGVTGQKMFKADSNAFSFAGALSYGGTVDSITYYVGAMDTSSLNPNDYLFFRNTRSTGTLRQRVGLTQFSITYYDTVHKLMTFPITSSAALAAIRSIDIKFRLESFEPVTTIDTTSYYAVTWEKLVYPRNLGKPR